MPFSISKDFSPSGRFSDRNAVVTGGGSGVGFEVAQMLAREGARVLVVDRRVEEDSREQSHEQVDFLVADITEAETPRLILARAAEEFDLIVDVLVNCAGVTYRSELVRSDDQLIEATLSVNLSAAIRLTRMFVADMRHQSDPAIVNVASITALRGVADAAVYSASKGGIVAFSRALAIELASAGIRVNAVCPSVVDSPMTHDYVATQDDPEAAYADLMRRQPLGRMVSCRDVASAILFLASTDAAMITGVALPVDGGRSARA